MSYSKSDFLSWDDDINLDALLGEYTCSEVENSDDNVDDQTVNVDVKVNAPSKKAIYFCVECTKGYSSISGIRGHMRTKHGVQKVKASKFRKDGINPNEPEREQPFKLETETFNKLFEETCQTSLVNAAENKFRNLKSSVNGKGILLLADSILQSPEKQRKIKALLQPLYFNIKTSDEDFILQFTNILSEDCAANQPLRHFVGVFNRQLITDLIRQRLSMFETAGAITQSPVSENDQSVLFYISGYIINSMTKKLKTKSISHKEENAMTALEAMLQNESGSKKPFITKYAKRTEKVNRGGLKVPSDNFFLFIRECENCIRNNIDEHKITSTTFTNVNLKEILMDDHMVKLYAEKVTSGSLSMYIIEQCVTLFLTVRGSSAARKSKNKILEKLAAESSKYLRKVLKEKTNQII